MPSIRPAQSRSGAMSPGLMPMAVTMHRIDAVETRSVRLQGRTQSPAAGPMLPLKLQCSVQPGEPGDDIPVAAGGNDGKGRRARQVAQVVLGPLRAEFR